MSNIAFVCCVDVYHYDYGGVDLFLFGVDSVFFIGLVGAISLVVVVFERRLRLPFWTTNVTPFSLFLFPSFFVS